MPNFGKSTEYEDIDRKGTNNDALFSIAFDKGFSLFVRESVSMDLLYRDKHGFAMKFLSE
ncbi:hypothetical protein J22TS3_50450 [Paenibacillus sp. J22TS3]|nr:hypothetical protein J22TS3_50450 [Paenibacillus sp. J22TS3]